MDRENSITFRYGALSPSLEEQANSQGFTLGDQADFLEKLRAARTLLMFHVLTYSQDNMIMGKIHKRVIESLQPINMGER